MLANCKILTKRIEKENCGIFVIYWPASWAGQISRPVCYLDPSCYLHYAELSQCLVTVSCSAPGGRLINHWNWLKRAPLAACLETNWVKMAKWLTTLACNGWWVKIIQNFFKTILLFHDKCLQSFWCWRCVSLIL